MSNIDDAMKYFNDGNEYAKKREDDKAIECYTKAIELFLMVMGDNNIEEICSSILNIDSRFYAEYNYKSVINILKRLPESSLLYCQFLFK